MSGGSETIRLEEFTGVIQSGLIAVYQPADATASWLPTEFLLSQYITRILVVGRTAPASLGLAADSSWTQVWRSPGAKEWSCLLGILQHMPGPVLIVLGPDVGLTPKLVASLKGATTTVVLRSPAAPWPPVCDPPDKVFFPTLGPSMQPVLTEWVPRAAPRSLDLKSVVPQLVAASYGLLVSDGIWHWFRPADSPPLATLTVAQIGRSLQGLAAILEKMVI